MAKKWPIRKRSKSRPDVDSFEGLENAKQLLRTLTKKLDGDDDFVAAIVLRKSKKTVDGMFHCRG